MAYVGISVYFWYAYREILLLLCPLTAEESPLLCWPIFILLLQEIRHTDFDGFWWVCLVIETFFWNESLFQFKGSRSWSWIFGPPLAVTDAWTLNMLLYKLQPHIGASWQLIHKGERTQPNTNVKIALYSLSFSFWAHFIFNITLVIFKAVVKCSQGREKWIHTFGFSAPVPCWCCWEWGTSPSAPLVSVPHTPLPPKNEEPALCWAHCSHCTHIWRRLQCSVSAGELGEGMCGTEVMFWHKSQWFIHAVRSNAPPTQTLVGSTPLPTGLAGCWCHPEWLHRQQQPWALSSMIPTFALAWDRSAVCAFFCLLPSHPSSLCHPLAQQLQPFSLPHIFSPINGTGPRGREQIFPLQGRTCLSARWRQGLQESRRKCNAVMREGNPCVGFFSTGRSFSWSIRTHFLYLACP